MAREKSPAQSIFDDIVKRAVTSVLKPLGFQKSAFNFCRRHKDVVQVVNLQASLGSVYNEKLFYVNVGLAFDAICQLTHTEILDKPKEYDCDSRGTRDRLENLIDNTPERWSVNTNGNSDSVAKHLQNAIELATTEVRDVLLGFERVGRALNATFMLYHQDAGFTHGMGYMLGTNGGKGNISGV
jgi:hypothetical protein